MVLGALLPKVKIKNGKGVYMSKHTSISNHAVLRTATVLLALATGVFSSRADHFEWSEPNTGVYYSEQLTENDGVYEWYNSSYAEEGDAGGGGSTASWSGHVRSVSQVDTTYPGVLTSGHTVSTYAEVHSQFSGEWVSDEDGPPSDATIDYGATISGSVFGNTTVQQSDNFITNFIAGANADAQYDFNPLLDGYINLGGGITNGPAYPTNSMGGGVQGYSNLDIDPVEYELEHLTPPDYWETWVWWQRVNFSLDVSDSYTVGVGDAVFVDLDITASTAADLLINKEDSTSGEFGAVAQANCEFYASFSYTVTPNY